MTKPKAKRPAPPLVGPAQKIVEPVIKNHFILVCDHSGSMDKHAKGAAMLYDSQLDLLEKEIKQQSRVSVVKFGVFDGSNSRGAVKMDHANAAPFGMPRYRDGQRQWEAQQGTPLYDAIMRAAQHAEMSKQSDEAVVILSLTDGEENESHNATRADVKDTIIRLQVQGDYTFAFLVPPGYKNRFVQLSGVHEGNVAEWGDAKIAAAEAEVKTSGYLDLRRTSGGAVRSSRTYFQTDLSKIKPTVVKRLCADITDQVKVYTVDKERPIEEFINFKTRGQFAPGRTFYEVMKKEKELQDYKKLLIQDKATGQVYADGNGPGNTYDTVRNLLGLPDTGTIALEPGNHANYTIYAQSMSKNRKLPRGTKVVFWNR